MKPQISHEPMPPFPKQKQEGTGQEHKLNPRPQYQAPHYRAAGKLQDKAALITGGDSGIGRAVAVMYAREGADVAIAYLENDRDAEETASAVRAEGRTCILLRGDLSEKRFCEECIERTVNELGKIDILIHNAAYQRHKESIEQVTEAELERTFRTNIFAYFFLVQAAVPYMKPGSSIIGTSSITGITGSKKLLDYSATKGAMNAFTKSLAQNLIDKGIRVNAVAPGPVWTPLNAADAGRTEEEVAEFGKSVPMKRPAQPEEIAPSFVFFASDADSSYITGEVLTQLGGETTAAA